jgi:hypothetical protein
MSETEKLEQDLRQVALDEVTTRIAVLTNEIDERQARVHSANLEKNHLVQHLDENAAALKGVRVQRDRCLIDGADTVGIDKNKKALDRECQVLESSIGDCQTVVAGNTTQIERLRRFRETAQKQAKKFTVLIKYQDLISAMARDSAKRLADLTPELSAVGLNASELFPVRFVVLNTTIRDIVDYPENPLRFEVFKS